MNGKTKSGFKYEINEKILSDWRFLVAASKAQSKDSSEQLAGAVEMVQLILGNDGYEGLIKHISERNDGSVPVEAVLNEVAEIINNHKETKN